MMKQYCIIYKIAQRYEYFLEYPNPLCESIENNTLLVYFYVQFNYECSFSALTSMPHAAKMSSPLLRRMVVVIPCSVR